MGQFESAVRAWKKTLRLDPSYAEAYNHLGYLYAERGENLNQALRWTQKAVELRPENGNFHDSLGWAYYQLKKYPLALRHLQLAVDLMRSREGAVPAVVYDHLAGVYQALGQLREAENAWRQAQQLEPNNVVYAKKLRLIRAQIESSKP